MTDIILGMGVAAFIVYTGFHISYLLRGEQSCERIRDIFQNTAESLNAALAGFRNALENVRAASEDVRQIGSTVPRL